MITSSLGGPFLTVEVKKRFLNQHRSAYISIEIEKFLVDFRDMSGNLL